MRYFLIESLFYFFFFQAEDGIRDDLVTGVQTCALPISAEASVRVIPKPASVDQRNDGRFRLSPDTEIVVGRSSAEAASVANYLADLLRRSTGYSLPVVARASSAHHPVISLKLTQSRGLRGEAYALRVSRGAVRIEAGTSEGLFRAVQTLRQLLPAKVESASVQPGPWSVRSVRILDRPRFAWRGAHLDVSRHFFTVEEVKRYIDLISQYKVNVLHLHLSDDQGWRIVIDSWPRLATYGGSLEVGGTPGGFYTQDDYRAIVAYAAARYITIVPEIDTPGHTNAALASYAELNCDGVAPPLYTGTDVGFSSLCVGKEITYTFLDDVLRELARITPGEYLHIGGDEAHATTDPDYLTFMGRVLPLVAKYGKKVSGWHEFVKATPPVSAIPQFWGVWDDDPSMVTAAARGNQILLSPANKVYLDMKYDKNTPLGLDWAGYIEVADAYGW